MGILPMPKSQPLVLCVVYGFPGSHVRFADNEALLSQTLICLAKLNLPAILMGDLNVSLANSRVLALAFRVGFWEVEWQFANYCG